MNIKMNKNDTYQGAVFQTTDYSQFKKLLGNRDITERRKTTVRNSVKANGQLFTVVICNEKMEIVDGQCRVEVFEEMGLPVNYIVKEGLTAKDCAVLNAATTSWKITDYIDMYCALNLKPFVKLRYLQDQHKKVSIKTLLFALSGSTSPGSNHDNWENAPTTAIKKGTFVADSEAFREADRRLEYAERFLDSFGGYGKENILCAAVYAYGAIPDREKLLEKWDKYSQLKSIARPAATIADALAMLEACYNYKARPGDLFYLTAEYEKYAKTRKSERMQAWRGKE